MTDQRSAATDGEGIPTEREWLEGLPEDRVAAIEDEPYVISDERLVEIRALINWNHSGWQTIPSGPNVTKYDLAAAVEDLLMERDERA